MCLSLVLQRLWRFDEPIFFDCVICQPFPCIAHQRGNEYRDAARQFYPGLLHPSPTLCFKIGSDWRRAIFSCTISVFQRSKFFVSQYFPYKESAKYLLLKKISRILRIGNQIVRHGIHIEHKFLQLDTIRFIRLYVLPCGWVNVRYFLLRQMERELVSLTTNFFHEIHIEVMDGYAPRTEQQFPSVAPFFGQIFRKLGVFDNTNPPIFLTNNPDFFGRDGFLDRLKNLNSF